MANVYFSSDLHIGHKSILKFAGDYRGGNTVDEHDNWLVEQWNSIVTKRDIVYCLGDVCMDANKAHYMGKLNGTKILLLGNHDQLPLEVYLKYFKRVTAMEKYKGFWITHCPMHPQELFGKKNIHGHVHQNYVPDSRYINVCTETSGGVPILFEDIKNGTHYNRYTSFLKRTV
jgi:calcineurin-like phosphoesterase family protein